MHGRRMMKLFQLFDLTVKSIRLNVKLKIFSGNILKHMELYIHTHQAALIVKTLGEDIH